MTRFPLDAAIDCGALGDATVLGDVCARWEGQRWRCALTDSGGGALAAALIVDGAALELRGGAVIALEERLLDDGTVDLTDAQAITVRLSDAASAWVGVDPGGDLVGELGVALALRMRDGRIGDAAAVIAGVAAYPLRARQLEGALRGRTASAQLLGIAGQTARIEAQPFGVGEVIDEAALERLAAAAREAVELALRRGGGP